MFRRKWSNLPADPVFPVSLAGLGYFVNEDDEVRNIENPKLYFKYFLTKDERTNDRQRFAFNSATQAIVRTRLEAEGMVPINLGGQVHTDRFVTILASRGWTESRRIVVIVGQSVQGLGVIAHRVVGGPGGIDAGSMVSVVRALRRKPTGSASTSTSATTASPAIVIANPGELWWWPEGKKGLTPPLRHAAPMPSAVHWGWYHDPAANDIPGHRNPVKHVERVFEYVRQKNGQACLDIIAVGDGAEAVSTYLERHFLSRHHVPEHCTADGQNQPISSFSALGSYHNALTGIRDPELRRFYRERARAWCTHDSPLGTLISGPDPNPNTFTFTQLGCPLFSSGTPQLVELILVTALPAVVAWIQEVALVGPGYKNPEFPCDFSDLPERSTNWVDEKFWRQREEQEEQNE